MKREIRAARKTGATPGDAPSTSTVAGPYTAVEITRAICRLRACRGGFGCAMAALKSSVLAGRRATACLANVFHH
eukprot:4521486-Pyramimonas_sp.AAC.1